MIATANAITTPKIAAPAAIAAIMKFLRLSWFWVFARSAAFSDYLARIFTSS